MVVSFNTSVTKLTVLSSSTTSSLLALLHVNVSFFYRLINVIILLSVNVVVSFNTSTMEADWPLWLYHRLTARTCSCQWYVIVGSSARMHLAKWPFAWRWVSTKCSFGFISTCRSMICFGWAYSSFYLFTQLRILRMANHDKVLVLLDLS